MKSSFVCRDHESFLPWTRFASTNLHPQKHALLLYTRNDLRRLISNHVLIFILEHGGAFHTKDVFNLFIAQDEVLGRLSAAASRKVLK